MKSLKINPHIPFTGRRCRALWGGSAAPGSMCPVSKDTMWGLCNFGPALCPFLSVCGVPHGGALPLSHPPHLPPPYSVLFSLPPADEMTVGKVYAALMIFDFYKQNKTTRDQIHQATGGLSQVPGFRVPKQ